MFHVEHLSEDVKDKLEIYKNLLMKWQKSINLVSRGTLEDFWNRHVKDSLQLIPFLHGKSILDIGSGAGLPGIVIAISTPLFKVTCIDSDNRKIQFLSEVSRLTSSRVELISDRIQNLDTEFDTIVSRGFAKLEILAELTMKHSGYGVFLKGAKIDQEIQEAKNKFCFEYNIHKSTTDDSGRIIVIYNVKKNG